MAARAVKSGGPSTTLVIGGVAGVGLLLYLSTRKKTNTMPPSSALASTKLAPGTYYSTAANLAVYQLPDVTSPIIARVGYSQPVTVIALPQVQGATPLPPGWVAVTTSKGSTGYAVSGYVCNACTEVPSSGGRPWLSASPNVPAQSLPGVFGPGGSLSNLGPVGSPAGSAGTIFKAAGMDVGAAITSQTPTVMYYSTARGLPVFDAPAVGPVRETLGFAEGVAVVLPTPLSVPAGWLLIRTARGLGYVCNTCSAIPNRLGRAWLSPTGVSMFEQKLPAPYGA